MVTKAVTETDKKITQILTQRETETGDIKKQIEEVTENINKLNTDLEKARKSGETESYKEVLKNIRDNQDTLKMHNERLTELEEKPLITPGEYEALVSDIRVSFSMAEDEANEKLYKLSKEMEKVADEMTELLDRSNKTLRRLQHDVYRDADRKRTIYGYICDSPISINKNSTIYWGKVPTQTQPYINYSKTKGAR